MNADEELRYIFSHILCSKPEEHQRQHSPGSYPSVDERDEIERMMKRYPKPEIISRMKPIGAPPPEGETTQEEDVQMGEEEQPSAATSKEPESEAQPVSPEVDPMDYKEGEGRSTSPTATWTNPPYSGPFSAKENEPSSSSWKQTYDNIRRVKKRAQEKKICLCCGSDGHSLGNCDNENFAKDRKNIVECFDHIEKILKVNFTDRDEEIVKKDQAEREKKRAKTTKDDDDDDDIEMECIDLPEETTQLGGESLTPSAAKQSKSKASSNNDDYEEAVKFMKRSFGNPTIITRFNEPVDICTIADEQEGGAFKVINRRVDMSVPLDKRALDGILTRAQAAGCKLPKVSELRDDPLQTHKNAYRLIWPDCERGNTLKSSRNMALPFASRSGMEKGSNRYGLPYSTCT